MDFRILGPLEVRDGTRRLPLDAPKQRSLLTVLLLHANRVVSTDQLIDELWDEAPPATARTTLQNHIRRLRAVLGLAIEEDRRHPRLVFDPPGYLVQVASTELDLHRFEQLAEQGRTAMSSGQLERAANHLRAALDLWRGPALAGVALGPISRSHAAHLEEARFAALEHRIRADLELGRHGDLVAELEALAREHPLRERLHGQLMLALYRTGRRAEALEVYQRARRLLVDNLGIEPNRQLQELQQAVLAADPALDLDRSSSGSAVVQTATLPVRQLPPDSNDFVGRRSLVHRLERLLDEPSGRATAPRVVVITGQPGVGKTALAVHVAQRLSHRFPDGQLYASLHGSQSKPLDPTEIVAGFLRALGADPGAIPQALEERVALYRSRLADRRVLVVLDDVATAAQVRPLMPGTPAGATLVTGRSQPVGLEGAQIATLEPLPPAEALELLARTAGGWRVQGDPATAATITRLCGHLPLALRIAGARLAAKPHWSLEDLAERLGDERRRLAELHAGDLDVRASVDLSYQACRPAERRAFRLLALVEGHDVTAWAAAPLLDLTAGAATNLLEDLVDASLLSATRRDPLGQLRYRFHDLIRLFAHERLFEEEPKTARQAALNRLLATFTALAQQSDQSMQAKPDPLLQGHAPGIEAAPIASLAAARPLDWFDIERTNLVAAVSQAARGGHTDHAVALTLSLVNFLEVRQHLADWESVTSSALEAAVRAGDRHAEASLLLMLEKLRCEQGRFGDALACHARCLPMAQELGDRRLQAEALRIAALIHRLQGRLDEAIACARQSRRLLRMVRDRHTDSTVLLELAEVHRLQGHHQEAVACLRRASVVFEDLGDQVWTARAQLGLANALRAQDHCTEALDLLQSAQTAFQHAGDRRGEAHALRGVAELLRQQGRHRTAIPLFQRCLDIFTELGDDAGAARAQYGLGEALRQAGETAEAMIWFERCLPVFGRLGYRHWRARALQGHGAALAARGDRAGAEARWREALELFEALGMPEAEGLRKQLGSDITR